MMETLNRLQAHAGASGIAVLHDGFIPLDPVTNHGGAYDFVGNYVLLRGFDSTLLALVLAHELGHAEQRNLYLGALTSVPDDTLVRVEADAWHRGIALYLNAGGAWTPDLSAFVLRCLGSYLTPMMAGTTLQDELFEINALCRDLERGTA